MRYGGMNFPVLPVLEEIEEISGLDFDYIELTMDPPQAHHRMISQQKDRISQAVDRLGIGIMCHLPTFVSTADLTDSLREASLNEVLTSLEMSADLGALKAVLHPSFITGLSVFVMAQARRYALRSLEAIVEKSLQLELDLCVENMFPRSNSLVDQKILSRSLKRFRHSN